VIRNGVRSEAVISFWRGMVEAQHWQYGFVVPGRTR
jgi:hypothetical protein